MRLAILSLGLLASTAYAANTGTITVNFSNISNNQGVVRAALFNSAQTFQDSSAANVFAKNFAPISNNTATVTFNNVPYGTYAIKAFHDQNMSGVMPRSMFGAPQTDYGFSNGSGGHGAPSFEQAQFVVNSANTTINIKMIQP